MEDISGPKPEEAVKVVRASLQDYFESAIKNGEYICWIARQNGEMTSIGGMTISKRPANFRNTGGAVAYIMNMYTLPAYRGKGLCTSLLAKLTVTAKEKGIQVLELHATNAGEPVYRKAGFAEPFSIMLERNI
jgi:predicted acetyltransferase